MILVVILSTCPAGISGPRSGKFVFFSITNCRFGTDSVTLYGPTPGGGFSVRFLQGVSPGTSPTNHIASTFENEPSARVEMDLDVAGLVVRR